MRLSFCELSRYEFWFLLSRVKISLCHVLLSQPQSSFILCFLNDKVLCLVVNYDKGSCEHNKVRFTMFKYVSSMQLKRRDLHVVTSL